MFTKKIGATIALGALAALAPFTAIQANAQEAPSDPAGDSPAACRADQLRVGYVDYVPGSGGMGSWSQQVTVENTDPNQVCSMMKIPNITPVDEAGNRVAPDAFIMGTDTPPTELAPGERAVAEVRTTHAENYPNCDLVTAAKVRVSESTTGIDATFGLDGGLNTCANPDVSVQKVSDWAKV